MLDIEQFSHPPKKQEFAAIFRLVSRISFWVQLVLGGVSGIAVFLSCFSRSNRKISHNQRVSGDASDGSHDLNQESQAP